MNLLKQIKLDSTKKKLVENFFSLSVLQAGNYILPLIALPYLVRVLGPSKYGLIMFSQAFIQYFIILTDYGFNLSATREVSISRLDKQKLSEIFSSVLIVKILLLAASAIAFAIMLITVDRFSDEWLVYGLTFGGVIGTVLFPMWFFQGIEEMKYISVLNLVARLLYTISIFIFISDVSDYIIVPLLNSSSLLLAGLTALGFALIKFKIRIRIPGFSNIYNQLKNGWHTFVSGMAISLYTNTNIFLLGVITNDNIVGYYAAAERIIRALINLFTPLFTSLYPYVTKIASNSREAAIKFMRKLLKYVLSFSIIVWLLIFFIAEPLLILILSESFKESILIFKVFSPLIIIIPIASILLNLAMLSFNMDRPYSKIYLAGSVINIILIALFVYLAGLAGFGAALSGLLTEIIIVIFAMRILHSHNIRLFSFLKFTKA